MLLLLIVPMLERNWKNPDVVAGCQFEGTAIGRDLDWKDPDVVAGRDVDWKGRRLEGLEGMSIGRVGSGWGFEGMDPDIVAGRNVNWKGWKGCQLEGLYPDVDWKGCIRTLIGRDVDWKGWIRTSIGRDINWKGWIRMGIGRDGGWKGRWTLLLIVPIDAVVVDCLLLELEEDPDVAGRRSGRC